MAKTAKLTEKQQRFVEEYLIDLNATQAAIRAGYSAKTADQQGSRMLANVKVQQAISVAMAERSKRTGINQDRVVLELARIAFGGGQSSDGTLYRVQTGAFSVKENADRMLEKVKTAGFDTYMVQVDGLYKIQVGAYSVKANADAMASKLKAAGFDTFITTQGGQAVSTVATPTREVTVGSTVRVKDGAKTYSGGSLASFVYKRDHQVSQLSGDRAVISYNGTVVAAVHKSDLILV